MSVNVSNNLSGSDHVSPKYYNSIGLQVGQIINVCIIA